MPSGPPFSEDEARRAIAEALCWSDALRNLGYRPVGHNIRTLQRHAHRWDISTDHFDLEAVRRRSNRRRVPIEAILVEGSTFSRGHLKERLYDEGLKQRRCERCNIGELWHGRAMSLVLDHVNGDATDNRIENLRILCPNCAATLDTHCGRNLPRERTCPACEKAFAPHDIRHRYCSLACGAADRQSGQARDGRRSRYVERNGTRKVNRPPYDELVKEIAATSYCAVGRK